MQQLNPKAVWLFFISILLWTLPSLFLVIVLELAFSGEKVTWAETFNAFMALPAMLLPLIVLIALVWAKLSYKYYRYELREDGFRKEYGIIWKKYSTIPYDRIQNVDIYRGLIARLLGLSDLQIQTAGGLSSGSYGAFSEGRLPGLSREVAEQVRDELVKRVRSSKR